MYQRTAHFYDLFDLDAPAPLWHAEFLLRYARPGMRLLDVGAGSGRAALLLAEQGVNVTCVEPSDAMRMILLGRIADDSSRDAHLTVLPGELQTLALHDTFDIAAACHVLYLLPPGALERGLAALRAHLNPGGWLIGDFALRSGREAHARRLAAERVIGAVTYRKYTAAQPLDDFGRWRVSWEFEALHRGARIEHSQEHFEVHARDADACRALLARHGFAIEAEFGDYGGARWRDDASASRYVFVAR